MKNRIRRLFGEDQPTYVRRRDVKRLHSRPRPDVVARHEGKTIVTESKPRLKISVPGRGWVDAESYMPVEKYPCK